MCTNGSGLHGSRHHGPVRASGMAECRTRVGYAPGVKYRMSKVERDITAYVSATGTLNPVIMVQVGTQVSGTVKNSLQISIQRWYDNN